MNTVPFLPRSNRSFFAVFLSFLAMQANMRGATVTWTNVNGGNWNVAANWNPNQVPGDADNAVITANGTYTVTLDMSATVTSLTLGGTTGEQTFAQNGQTFTVSGAITVNANGVYDLSGTLSCNGSANIRG